MPVVIKTGTMKYKSPTAGRYVEINMLSDNATQEQIAAIRAAGADETAGVHTAAEAALAAAETANTAAAGADTAASNANTKATLADEKASLADTAATNANTKAALADEKATLANTKAALADEKATLANTKAALADEKATLADQKATAANTAAGAANTAAGTANAAATKIDDMTVAASGLAAGASPTVQVSEVSGHKHLAFGIPKGDTGEVPDIQIGTVTTVQPDQPASVTRRSGSPDEEPIFDFALPKGETGSVENVYGTTIEMSSSDSTKVAAAIGGKTDKVQNATSGNLAGLDANGNLTDSGYEASDFADAGDTEQSISGLADALAIVTDGDTHIAISSGQFVYVRNHSTLAEGLYKASSNIAANGALSSSNLTADSSGGLNSLAEQMTTLNSKLEAEISLPSGYSASGNNKVYKVGKVVQFSVALTIPAWTTKTLSINELIPSGFTPGTETNFAGIDNTNDLAISCFISSGGNLSIYRSHTTSCTSLRLGVTYLT